MIESGDILKVEQEELETVIPVSGGKVVILKGQHRGTIATLGDLNIEDFNAKLIISEGPFIGTILPAVDYSDFSKLA